MLWIPHILAEPGLSDSNRPCPLHFQAAFLFKCSLWLKSFLSHFFPHVEISSTPQSLCQALNSSPGPPWSHLSDFLNASQSFVHTPFSHITLEAPQRTELFSCHRTAEPTLEHYTEKSPRTCLVPSDGPGGSSPEEWELQGSVLWAQVAHRYHLFASCTSGDMWEKVGRRLATVGLPEKSPRNDSSQRDPSQHRSRRPGRCRAGSYLCSKAVLWRRDGCFSCDFGGQK